MTRYAVTGATGWLGRAALERLASGGADVVAFASRQRGLTLADGREVAALPLAELPATPFDVLLHFAYRTREHAAEMGLESYVAANEAITATVVEAIERQRPRGVGHASSGAVYEEGGRLAADLEANPYGVLKLRDEQAIAAAASAVDAGAVNVRVFNVAGPYLTKPSGFALSDIVLQATSGGPVRLRAQRPVVRSYVDVDDLAALLIAEATAGECGTFDTAGDEEVEVGALAERIVSVLRLDGIEIEREWDPAADPDRYVGDPTEMRRLAAGHGLVMRGLDEQILRTAGFLEGRG